MKPTKPTPQNLAVKFAELLKRDLTPDQVNEAVKRNKTDEYQGCCATHDFCDANVYMDEALEHFTGKHEVDVNDEDTTNLFNEAWDIAKANEFFTGYRGARYFVKDKSGRSGHYEASYIDLATDTELNDDDEFMEWLESNDVGDTYTEFNNQTITRTN